MIESRAGHAGRFAVMLFAFVFAALPAAALPAAATDVLPEPGIAPGLPPYLADRGRGMSTSQFGTYVDKGEWLVYAFYEYTKTSGFEYAPDELGFAGTEEYLGTLTEREALLFISYGISERLEVEIEGALHASASLDKAPDDVSSMPDPLEESGLGDVEGQVRWRWSEETERRPELFSFFEVVLPLQKEEVLLGTQDWEYALGFAAIKGHTWGTLTGRVSLSYSESQIEVGEYAVEYLKRVSPSWRLYAAIEGEQADEISLIVEGQARLGRHVLLKLNSGFGLTTKAPDVAPEVGVLFAF